MGIVRDTKIFKGAGLGSGGCPRTTLTYGVLPSFDVFEKHFDCEVPDGRFRIRLGRSDARAADGTSIGDGEYSAKELYKGLKELVAKNDAGAEGDSVEWEAGDHAASLASSILERVGIEWI